MQYVPALHLEAVDFIGNIFRWIEDIRLANARHAAYARTFKELSALTDRELSDIGISRSDIADIARRGAEAL